MATTRYADTQEPRRAIAPRVAAMVALGVVLSGCSDDGPPAAEHVVYPGSGPATELDGCPSLSEEFDRPYAELPDAVPEGAVAARACRGGGITGSAPDDLLTTSIDVLVDSVNALPEQELSACFADLGAGYRILFDYEDGSTFLISAHYGGCEDVVVGSSTRDRPRVPAKTFLRLLREQRAATTPPSGGVGEPATCAHNEDFRGPFAKLPEPIDIRAADFCTYDSEQERQEVAPMRPREVAVLRRELAAAAPTDEEDRCRDPKGEGWIVATTTWGDALVVGGSCSGYLLPTGELWVPSPRAERIIDRLVSAARPVR